MLDIGKLLLHLVLTINVAGLLALVISRVARAEWNAAGPAAARRFIHVSIAVLVLKVAFVVLFVQAFPERVLSTDGVRYFNETRQIAQAPWLWNPIAGTGPKYSESPKMGMSYLYGVILYAHGVDSLYGVLLLNVALAYLTCLMVYLLAGQLSDARLPAHLAMLGTAVYPETAFWTARVVRENLTLFLVPLLLYAAIRFRASPRLRYAAIFLGSAVVLVLTRAQLGVLLLLIAGYYITSLLSERLRFRSLLIAVLVSLAGLGLLNFVRSQIREAVGQKMTHFLSLDLAFWVGRLDTLRESLPRLLSFVAREGYGLAGLLLAPAVAGVSVLFVLAVLNARRIFPGRSFAAGLLLCVVLGFLFGLACAGLYSIRFRSTIAPLVIPVVCVTAHYYWRAFRLPRLVLHARRPARA